MTILEIEIDDRTLRLLQTGSDWTDRSIEELARIAVRASASQWTYLLAVPISQSPILRALAYRAARSAELDKQERSNRARKAAKRKA